MRDIACQYPWALALLPVMAVMGWLRRRHVCRRGYAAVGFVGNTFSPGVVKRYGGMVSESLCLILLILAIMNIQYDRVWEEQYLESKWIMIVQDLSGSMNRPGSRERHLTLGDITLAGARSFIEMRQPDDLIGVAAFSNYAKLISPPTFDKSILKQRLDLLSRKGDSIVFRELTAGGATNASYAAWLALSTFFMMLPEEHQLSFAQLKDLRHGLLGKILNQVEIPRELKQIEFGRGMAIIMFTDGRIETSQDDADVRQGLPNFVNVVKLIRKLGVNFYLIVAGAEVAPELETAISEPSGDSGCGRIFYMPGAIDTRMLKGVYAEINKMEPNRILVKMTHTKKSTRWTLSAGALFFLAANCFFKYFPGFGSI